MINNIKNHSQEHYYNANSRKLTLIGITFSLMLLLLISCNSKVQETQNSVSVSGVGTVFAQSDMVRMTVYSSHVAPTTKEAKKVVEQTMQQVLKILQEENIESKFIKTESINCTAEYKSNFETMRSVLIGQRARQTIVVTINDMINTPEKFSSILDKITAIDRVEVNNVRFDIEDKADLLKQSRELAYQKAFDKAKQYAELSERKIGKVLTISEGISRDVTYTRMFMNNARIVSEAQATADYDGSSVPTGEQGVTSEINVIFSLE
jgi:uncharacterized protein YggE